MSACHKIIAKLRARSLTAPLRRFALIVPLGASALIAFSGCGPHADRIADLNDNPGEYMRRNVTITGEVTRVYELPLGIANLAAYRVNDGSGQIWVVTHNGAPNRGDRVGLRGEYEPIANLGGDSLLGNLFGNVIEEHNRKFE